MQINLEKAFFYCYGCGCKGSTFELFKLKQKGNKENNILLRIKLNKLLNRLNNNIYNSKNNSQTYSQENINNKDLQRSMQEALKKEQENLRMQREAYAKRQAKMEQ